MPKPAAGLGRAGSSARRPAQNGMILRKPFLLFFLLEDTSCESCEAFELSLLELSELELSAVLEGAPEEPPASLTCGGAGGAAAWFNCGGAGGGGWDTLPESERGAGSFGPGVAVEPVLTETLLDSVLFL